MVVKTVCGVLVSLLLAAMSHYADISLVWFLLVLKFVSAIIKYFTLVNLNVSQRPGTRVKFYVPPVVGISRRVDR